MARTIDRLHIASRDAVRPEQIADLVNVSVPASVANMIVSFLPADQMSWAEFDGILRYAPMEYARGQAAQLAAAGVVTTDDEGLRYTEAGRATAQACLDLLPAALDELWLADQLRLGALASVLNGVASRAMASGRPSTCVIDRTLVPKSSSTSYEIARAVAIARRHRADGHCDAWTEAGHTAASIQILRVGDERDRIEERTDALNAWIWELLSMDEQVLVLAGLSGLNGVGTPT